MRGVLLFVCCLAVVSSASVRGSDIVIGEIVSIHSDILDEERQVMIYLPDHYMDEEAKYPVLYVLDGRDHFLHTAGIVRFLSNANMAPEMIVVAILNVDRTRDFTIPSDDEQRFKGGGGAGKFTSFIWEELKPYIRDNYRTEDYSILTGHSLGGLFAVHTLLNHADMFNAYIAVSPSLWWNNEYLFAQLEQVIEDETSLDRFIYITTCREGNVDIITSTNNFVRLLEAQAPPGLDWTYAHMSGDIHPTTAHRSIYGGLELLFEGWRFDSTVKGADADRMRAHYRLLSQRYGFDCKPLEKWLVIIGYEALRAGRTSDAIDLFKYYVESYPESANSYDSLGEAYMKAGEKDLAIENYTKSLELNPDNHNARDMLELLGNRN